MVNGMSYRYSTIAYHRLVDIIVFILDDCSFEDSLHCCVIIMTVI